MANLGPKLYFSRFGGEQPIPPEFIAAMERQEEVQPLGENVTGPEALSDTIVESRVETNRTNERVRRTIKKKPGNITLQDVRTNSAGQPVQVTLTLFPTGSPSETPTATKNVAVKDLGNGWSIQEVGVEGTYVDGVFTSGVFANELRGVEKSDNIPTEFKAEIPTTTTRVDSAGTIATPTLTGNEVEEVQEQITSTKKRITIRQQDNPDYPVSLESQLIDDNGVVITRVKTLDEATQTITPSATVSGQVENLGGGLTLKVEDEVAEVFDGKQVSAQKPDVIPEAFRASVPAETTVETVEGTSVLMPTLGDNELEKTEQRITAHKKRVSVTERDNGVLPTLYGQEYDDQLHLALPYSLDVEVAGSAAGELGTEITPLSDGWDLVKRLTDVTSLEELHITYPSFEQVNLPNTLVSATAIFAGGVGLGSGSSQGNGGGTTYRWSRGHSYSSESSVAGDIQFRVRDGYSGFVPATIHLFFLPLATATESAILAKVGAARWPAIRTETENIILYGGSKASRVTSEASQAVNPASGGGVESFSNSQSESTDRSVRMSISTVTIPRTLHGPVTVGVTTRGEVDTSLDFGVEPPTLSATSPTQFPVGKFLLNANVDLFRYGYVRVTAVVVDITSDYV
jgi:hypothetical protein